MVTMTWCRPWGQSWSQSLHVMECLEMLVAIVIDDTCCVVRTITTISSLIDCLIALRSSGYHYINFNFLTCQRNMLSICTYIQQIDSLQLFAIKLGQKGAAWARTPAPCPPHPGGSMSATFSHPPLPSRSLVELYLVVCFSCGKEEKVLMKRNRKTADGQTRGRGQRNRVQRRQRWK